MFIQKSMTRTRQIGSSARGTFLVTNSCFLMTFVLLRVRVFLKESEPT